MLEVLAIWLGTSSTLIMLASIEAPTIQSKHSISSRSKYHVYGDSRGRHVYHLVLTVKTPQNNPPLEQPMRVQLPYDSGIRAYRTVSVMDFESRISKKKYLDLWELRISTHTAVITVPSINTLHILCLRTLDAYGHRNRKLNGAYAEP